MIGIILIAHAHIATETKEVVEHILGQQVALDVVDIANSDFSNQEQQQYELLLASANKDHGVLVMVDLFGATPCNIALKTENAANIVVVAGFNIPAVIKAITRREEGLSLKELAVASIEAGKQYMRVVSDDDHKSEAA